MDHTKLRNTGLTLDKLFLKTLLTSGHRYLTDGRVKTGYGEFYEAAVGVAGGLHRLLGQDRVVSVMDWNSMQFAQLLYAVPISGNIVHPVDVRQPTGQVLSSMREAGSSCLLYSPPFKGLAEAAVSAGLVKDEFCMSIDEATGQDLSHGNGETGLPELDETRVASVLFSSGTTGKPKGVRYRHRDIVLTVWAMETGLSAFPGPSRLTSSDTVFSLIPFFHLWSWGTLYISTLIGSNYVLGGRFDPRTTSELIKRSGATWMSMVPTMFSALTSYDRDSLDGMKVLIGGSAIPSSILRFASEHSIELAGIYGFTDGLAAGIGTSEIMDDLPSRNADAVNAVTPLVFTDFQIGGDGSELGFRAPWLPDGYFNVHEEKAYRGDWFYPGDSAEITGDGRIRIRDRIRDLIKSGGEFIPSALLEYYISEIDGISDVAVIGVPDERWGERPVAVYRTSDSLRVGDEVIVSHLRDLASRGLIREWWIPERFIRVESMPMTGTGKIDKKALRAALSQQPGKAQPGSRPD